MDEHAHPENPVPVEETSPEVSPFADTDFMREKIKQRPINRAKLLRRTVLTVALAIVFGLVACLTFLLLEPVFNRALNPEPVQTPNPVSFPEDPVEEEVSPEELIADDAEMLRADEQEVFDNYVLDASDYTEMYASLKAVATESAKSVVTVTGLTSGTDWWGDRFETGGSVSGLVVADNGYALLILTDYAALSGAEEIRVGFFQGTSAAATLLCRDEVTNLCVLSVPYDELSADVRELIPAAVLGSSVSAQIVGAPVIALGAPAGVSGSVVYGMVTSNSRLLSLTDANYALLTTDIAGGSASSGLLVNMHGEVLGIFMPSLTTQTAQDTNGQITAYGISSVRKLVECLSNNTARAALGVRGADVPADVREREEIPAGAYITRIEMDSPAMAAGIQSGDVITSLGDTEIVNFTALSGALLDMSPEDAVDIVLQRPGPDGYAQMNLNATLRNLSQ